LSEHEPNVEDDDDDDVLAVEEAYPDSGKPVRAPGQPEAHSSVTAASSETRQEPAIRKESM
jgi:hypothetical protein